METIEKFQQTGHCCMSFISVNVRVNFEGSWFIECKFDGCTVVGDPGGPLGFWPNSSEAGTWGCQQI